MSERDELLTAILGTRHMTALHLQVPADIVGHVAQGIADAILAAGYRKVEPAWAETLTNDGIYEYTSSSDCDGSNVTHWRRRPGLTYEGKASPWQAYNPEPRA